MGPSSMIVLDTHIWLWWIDQDMTQLGKHINDQIMSEDFVGVAAISCFEIAWLQGHNRISLPCDITTWFEKALTGSSISLIPLSPEIAKIAAELPEHHSDPQDRLIIATAISHNARIASKDKKFCLYKEVDNLLLQ